MIWLGTEWWNTYNTTIDPGPETVVIVVDGSFCNTLPDRLVGDDSVLQGKAEWVAAACSVDKVDVNWWKDGGIASKAFNCLACSLKAVGFPLTYSWHACTNQGIKLYLVQTMTIKRAKSKVHTCEQNSKIKNNYDLPLMPVSCSGTAKQRSSNYNFALH